MKMANKMKDIIKGKGFWYLDIFLFVIWLIAGFTVDGNGRFFGLKSEASYVVFMALFSIGLLMNGLLVIFNPKRRILALLFLLVYLFFAAPAFIGRFI